MEDKRWYIDAKRSVHGLEMVSCFDRLYQFKEDAQQDMEIFEMVYPEFKCCLMEF